MNGLHLWYYYAPRKKIYCVWCDDYSGYCAYNDDLEDGIMNYLKALQMTVASGKKGYARWDYVREHTLEELRGMCEVERLPTRKAVKTYPRKRMFQ